MTREQALRESIRDSALAGIEYAADVARESGDLATHDVLWRRRCMMASYLADMTTEPDYERTDAERVLLGEGE